MKSQLINIGFGNAVALNRVVAIVSPSSASGKRIREEARDTRMLIDATHGRKTRSIVIMDSNHIILSGMQPETLINRMNQGKEE
ncbi:MAG: DUF370 domain-containing protein [Spirochaetes bacterium]|nr:DUF370 domain-containing protein [Spirochaetota bacterium]MBN2770908.1 DUF370 domain-containing protein [Spirochaetota bacterium]HRX16511.1 DUF370 domain-containing protein [Spirochaetota bacterium]